MFEFLPCYLQNKFVNNEKGKIEFLKLIKIILFFKYARVNIVSNNL